MAFRLKGIDNKNVRDAEKDQRDNHSKEYADKNQCAQVELLYAKELSIMLSNNWLNVNPAADAALGKSELGVKPGRVFVSRT